MEASGTTYAELSFSTGLAKSTLRRMADGDLRGTLYSWNAVARYFGVPVSYFLGDSDGTRREHEG